MRHAQHVYYLHSDFKNRLARGERLLVNANCTDVDDDNTYALYSTLIGVTHDCKSLYQVGFGLGEHLVNLKRLLGNVAIAGCEENILYKTYGEKYLSFEGIRTDIGEFLFLEYDQQYDVIFSTGLFDDMKNRDIKSYLKNMYSLASRYLVVMESKVNEDTLKELGMEYKKLDYNTFTSSQLSTGDYQQIYVVTKHG